MPEYEAEVADAINNLADAVRVHAAVTATLAAGCHADTEGRQREMGAVFFEDARQQFADILKKVGPKRREEMHRYIDGLCRGMKRK